MANADQYKIVLKGSYGGEVINNIFWVSQVGGGGNSMATDLTNHFLTQWVQRIAAFQADTYEHQEIQVYNWNNPLDVAVDTTTEEGQVVDTGMPSYVTYNVRFNRGGTGFNYPQKRIAGVPESLTAINSLTGTTAADILAAINTNFFGGWSGVSGATPLWYAVSPQPPFGTLVSPGVPAGTRVQFYNTAIGVKLGTQKSRQP